MKNIFLILTLFTILIGCEPNDETLVGGKLKESCASVSCSGHGSCTVNKSGIATCNCEQGFILSEEISCIDIDECITNNNRCDAHATCTNIIGNYKCTCKDGYSGNGVSCTYDPCYNVSCNSWEHCNNGSCKVNAGKCNNSNDCIVNQICYENDCIANPCSNVTCSNYGNCFLNRDDQATCSCDTGYVASSLNCIDRNECASNSTNNCSTNATCTNIPGSYACECNTGYSGNGVTCEDINECNGTNNCDNNATCINTIGSYSCSCNSGYIGNGVSCEEDGTHCEVDQFSNPLNSTKETAKLITAVNYTNLSTWNSSCEKVEDWYKIVVPANRSLNIDLTFIHADGDIDVKVYKSDSTDSVAFSDSISDDESISYNVPEAGTYYIKIYYGKNSYDMSVIIDNHVNHCNGVDCGHGTCENQPSKAVCICNTGYKTSGLSCTFVCSDTNSHTNATNNGCSCNEGFRYNEDTEECIIQISQLRRIGAVMSNTGIVIGQTIENYMEGIIVAVKGINTSRNHGAYVCEVGATEYACLYINFRNIKGEEGFISPTVGAIVKVKGIHKEYYGETRLEPQIAEDFEIIGTGELPLPIEIPADEFQEKYEGMFVKIMNSPFIVHLESDSQANPARYDTEMEDRDGVPFKMSSNLHYPPYELHTGTTLTSIYGIIVYSYGQRKIYPRFPADLIISE